MNTNGTPKNIKEAAEMAVNMFADNPKISLTECLEKTISELVNNKAGIIAIGDDETKAAVICELVELMGVKRSS
jgi:hypothetical protein